MKCNAQNKYIQREAYTRAVKYMLLAFIQTLGDKMHCPPDKIVKAMEYCKRHSEMIAEGYTSIREAEDAVYKDYGIKFYSDGRIGADIEIEGIYDRDEWRPFPKVHPTKEGSYLITTRKGKVCTARYYPKDRKFNAACGRCAVAWMELPLPWEFYDDKDEDDENFDTV